MNVRGTTIAGSAEEPTCLCRKEPISRANGAAATGNRGRGARQELEIEEMVLLLVLS